LSFMNCSRVEVFFVKLVAIISLVLIVACDDMQVAQKQGEQSGGIKKIPSNVKIDHQGQCRHVVDGDSLYIAGQDTQVRLWGVDAPERDESGYQKAKQALAKLALKQNVYCATQDIDKYDRIVARCFLESGEEINQMLLASGVSQEYCRFSKNYYGFCR